MLKLRLRRQGAKKQPTYRLVVAESTSPRDGTFLENLGHYTGQDPLQFAFNIMTRSRRVTYDNLRMRDADFVDAVDTWFAAHEAERGFGSGELRPPMFQPFRLRELELINRIVVSAMDMYVAEDGLPTDFHLVHLGGKALGGAGLVMTEMVCVSEIGRITPGCTGIYTDEQARLVMLSETYRQSHEVDPANRKIDPDNRLLWHFRPRRLEAETIRDALLAVGGNLDPKLFGPSVLDTVERVFMLDLGARDWRKLELIRARWAEPELS